jgi:hypothetical protein
MSPKLRGDLASEEYVADPEVGKAKRTSWSPNEIVVHASMKRPGRLLVNQNWHPGWRSSVGTVVSDDGLLAVDLPSGEHDVTLAFRPRSALAGGAVTLIALASLVVLGMRARRGRVPFGRRSIVKTSALVLAPWAVLGVFVATWNEPRYPPAPLFNANGSPAVVFGPAPDAAKINARFDLPIVVDAVRFAGPDHLQNISVDLYFRRTGALQRTTGMFVHVIRREGQEPLPKTEKGKEQPDFYNADHQVVGGSFYLSDSPEGMVIHDAFGIHVGKAYRGEYDVWIGFGHVSGRRGRSKVIEAGKTIVNDNRIRVGSFFVR